MLKITGLWLNTDKNDRKYFSGSTPKEAGILLVPGTRVLIFGVPDDRKTERGPTHELFVAEDRPKQDTEDPNPPVPPADAGDPFDF